jgi:hypothetical protein
MTKRLLLICVLLLVLSCAKKPMVTEKHMGHRALVYGYHACLEHARRLADTDSFYKEVDRCFDYWCNDRNSYDCRDPHGHPQKPQR